MITFETIANYSLSNEADISSWIQFVIYQEHRQLGEVSYIFCNDEYLIKKNIKYLKHNTLTDVIGFDYCLDDIIFGDIFVSIERVIDNANDLNIKFEDELQRVMVHAILHFCGYGDKTEEERKAMRSKEDYYLSLRTF